MKKLPAALRPIAEPIDPQRPLFQTAINRRKAFRLVAGAVVLGQLSSCAKSQRQSKVPVTVSYDPYEMDVQMASRLYRGRILAKATARKLIRIFSSKRPPIGPVIVYNGVVLFDRWDLDGGGLTFAQDFGRTLLQLGFGRCERIFEFCAGPGYIGYWLLASGFCERLTLADINPLSIEAARQTAQFNEIRHLVNLYVSDSLKQIPENVERWDLVVGNPPHFKVENPKKRDLLSEDPGWSVHRDFYLSVKRFVKRGGHVVLVENSEGSNPRDFEPMIREGGGELLGIREAVTLSGKRTTPFYYMISEW